VHQRDLSDCHTRRAQFDGVTFAGNAWSGMRSSPVTRCVTWRSSSGDAGFVGVEFTGWLVWTVGLP
jgi:hypothetical protein